jgi:arylsulfatase A-like enzyme
MRGAKLSLYEGGIRLPFIACWPGVIDKGAENSTTVLAGVDMLPTLCHVAGVKVPASAQPDGEDIAAALLGKSSPQRTKPLFWEYGRNDKFGRPPRKRDQSPNLAIRDGKWKLLVNADGNGAELYDMTADVNEEHNLAAEHPDIARRLTEKTLEWRRSLP